MPFLDISSALVGEARIAAARAHMSVPQQIEHWARIGRAALDNPDLPGPFIRDAMRSLEETRAGEVVAYRFG